jgi:hypothetical protein
MEAAILAPMRVDVPETALWFGFVNEPVGTHTSRTIMVRELTKVLEEAGPGVAAHALREIAVDHNAVEKPSAAGRTKTFRHLRELYGMDPRVELFQALRIAWNDAESERPLLAALCAMARDPVYRASAGVVRRLSVGDYLSKGTFAAEVAGDFPGHYSKGVSARIGRNVASSWTQAGLLTGRTKKRRQAANAGPVSLAYAMYLGHLAGASGKRLFDTVWTSILDKSPAELESLAERASRQGWIEYRASGGMVDVTFRHLSAAIEA